MLSMPSCCPSAMLLTLSKLFHGLRSRTRELCPLDERLSAADGPALLAHLLTAMCLDSVGDRALPSSSIRILITTRRVLLVSEPFSLLTHVGKLLVIPVVNERSFGTRRRSAPMSSASRHDRSRVLKMVCTALIVDLR